MRSTKRPEPLDHFESDVRITRQDGAAQWRIRNGRRLPTAEYLAWCSWLSREPAPADFDRHTEPFEL